MLCMIAKTAHGLSPRHICSDFLRLVVYLFNNEKKIGPNARPIFFFMMANALVLWSINGEKGYCARSAGGVGEEVGGVVEVD